MGLGGMDLPACTWKDILSHCLDGNDLIPCAFVVFIYLTIVLQTFLY